MQKITIEPVTRIEGHAKVTIHLNGKGKVDKAYMHVNEWRGFEKVHGRPSLSLKCLKLPRESAESAQSATTSALPRPATV